MDNLNTIADPHSKIQKSWAILLLRWFLGSVAGSIGSSFLLASTFLMGPLPIVGIIVLGQYGLWNQIISSINFSLYDKIFLYVLNIIFSLLIYSILWGLIGALLASGRKKQIIIGMILMTLYVIAGVLSFSIYGSRMIPT